ncbi:WCX domain-containing protein [Enterococcus gallinarum]
MYAGKEVTFTFRFWGIIEAALDKLPNGKVIKRYEDDSVIIEATAYDTGVIMWLLSQGKNVQVLSPLYFVEKIKLEIESMQKRYTT